MKQSDGDQVQCPCCKECKNCTTSFQKVVDLKNAGLVIYRHKTRIEDIDKVTGLIEYVTKTTEDVFILHNTKDIEISSAAFLPEIEQNEINCPRCRKIIEHAQKLLQNVPTINRNDVKGICEHCRAKDAPCFECKEVVKKFVASKPSRVDNKEIVKQWLVKVKHLLKDAVVDSETSKDRKRAHSALYIDQLCRESPMLGREPDVKQMFHPETHKTDFAGALPSSIETRNNIFAYLPQLKKLENPVVFLEPSGKVGLAMKPSTSKTKQGIHIADRDSVYDSDVDSEVLKGMFFTPLTKKEKDRYVELGIPPVPFQSKEEVTTGRGESSADQRVGLDKKFYLDSWKDTKEKRFNVESGERHKIIRKYHSEEALLTTVAGVTGDVIKQDFSYVFPKTLLPDKKKLKRQKSSSELIIDTRDRLFAKAEEEKKRLEQERKIKLEEEERKKIALEEKKKEMKTKNIGNESKSPEPSNKPELERKIKEQQKEVQNEKPKKEKVTPTASTATSKTKFKESHPASEKKPKEDKKFKESKEVKEPKESKLPKEVKEPKEPQKPKEPKGPKELKVPKEPKGPTEPKEPKGPKELKVPKEPKEPTEPKEPKGPKVLNVPKEPEGPNEPKEPKGPKELKVPKEPKGPTEPKEPKGPKELKVPKEPKEPTEPKEPKGPKELKVPKEPKEPTEPKEPKGPKELKVLKEPKGPTEPKGPKELKVPKEPKGPNEPKEPKVPNEPKEPKADKDALKLDKDVEKAKKEQDRKEKEEQQQRENELKEKLKQREKDKAAIHGADVKAKEEARQLLKNAREEASPVPEIRKSFKKPEETKTKDLNIKSIKVHNASEDLILQLVKIKQSTRGDGIRRKLLADMRPKTIKVHKANHKYHKASICLLCADSSFELDADSMVFAKEKDKMQDIIIGQKLFKYKPPLQNRQDGEDVPLFFQSTFDDTNLPVLVKKMNEDARQADKKSPVKHIDQESSKGVIRYALSDRTYIDKGWTMLPTEKVVRKMNVYRMRPAQPQFDWFEHNKNKRLMTYDSGEKLAEFDDNGRGRWFYKNGRMALDYYDAEELNAQQRFVIYSSGEADERGRAQPYILLATFDYLGNGIVFDHSGKIRLKYNQTEGVVLDRSIGPVSHWKWHTLNDPPVLQQVMIDTQMAHKDPGILKMNGPHDNKTRPDNEDMLAIEFDNFIKEKSKKLSQSFKPFQIKMKALKINEHFSLKVLDQATVYLIFRDGTTNLKLNIGMVLDHKEIVDTDTAEVGEVSNNMERLPARTDSLAGLQKSIAYAQNYDRLRMERERRLCPPAVSVSADRLVSGASRPLRPRLRTEHSDCYCMCSRKPSASNIYYDTRLC